MVSSSMPKLAKLDTGLAQRLSAVPELGGMLDLLDAWQWQPVVEMTDAQAATVLAVVRERMIPETERLAGQTPNRGDALLLLVKWKTLAFEMEEVLRK